MPGPPSLTEASVRQLIELGHLSSGVGHHVINAFSAIVSNAELLRLEPPIPSIATPGALAETIIRLSLDAAAVARKLIDYARPVTAIDLSRTVHEPRTLSIDSLVESIFKIERENSAQNIHWETDFRPVPLIQGHPEQLACMVVHLLKNALEAIGDAEGTISLSTGIDHRGWIVLEIRDSGVGMPPPVQERAVEPFFSTKPGHLGVGLSIAHGIWRRHRGTLAVSSSSGEGTRMRLCVEPARVGV